MFVVCVTFEIRAPHWSEFVDAVMQQAQNSLQLEPDCHVFDVCLNDSKTSRVFLYEKYTDAAAFDLHLKSEHFAKFDELVTPWIEAKQVDTWAEASE